MSMQESAAALVLAAGKGTRMKSSKPKVLMELLGEPMLFYVYQALEPLFGPNVHTVIGHGAEQVRAAFPEREDRFVLQTEQRGTGHAFIVAKDALVDGGVEHVLVVNGDAPLLTTQALSLLVEKAKATDADIAFATLTLDDPGSYGRVLRGDDGQVTAIVEAKDLDPQIHGNPNEVNAGVYWLRLSAVLPLLEMLSDDNASGEYYITDLVDLGVAEGQNVVGVACGRTVELLGVNNPAELVMAEDTLAQAHVCAALATGALVRNPGSVRIGPKVVLEPGAEVVGPCQLQGEVHVSAGARVEANCVLQDAAVSPGAVIRNFSHLESCTVGPECVVGPYARLRPGAVLEHGSRVGNFVEMKKATLGPGAKANHLTYLGDAEVGAGTNIGAGTITCNYDGKNKHKTVIGERVFVGSNSALVAPITLGDEVLVAAGSTLTDDVEAGKLVIARTRQVTKDKRLKS